MIISILPKNQHNYHHNMTQQHRAAAYYSHNFKWKVFPVKNGDKAPITKNGVLDATLQKNLIKKWWTKNPNSNVGIATGSASGFIVIDVDKGGEESLAQLEEQYGPLPDTVESLTGGGGRHILLKIPDHFTGTIGNKVKFLPHVDIRGENGYIVAPPSQHVSGNFYEWESMSRPGEVEIQPIPNWLLTLLAHKPGEKVERKSKSHWARVMQGLYEGEGRNQAATSLAGHLFRHYVDEFLVIEIMKLWNERNNPPLGKTELSTILNSVARMEKVRRNGGEAKFEY